MLTAAWLLPAEAPAGPPAPSYSLQDLGTLPGAEQSWPTGLNDRGEVVGISWMPGHGRPGRGFLWSRERGIRRLGVGRRWCEPRAINNRGEVVGVYGAELPVRSGSTIERGFLWRNDAWTDLGDDFTPWLINDRGMVAGTNSLGLVLRDGDRTVSYGTLDDLPLVPLALSDEGGMAGYCDRRADPAALRQAFRTTRGSLELLPPLEAGAETAAYALDPRGRAIGYSGSPAYPFARQFVRWDASGEPRPIGRYAGFAWTSLYINRSGVMAGTFEPAFKVSFGLLERGGRSYNLDDLLPAREHRGRQVDYVRGLNDRGQILVATAPADPHAPYRLRAAILTPR